MGKKHRGKHWDKHKMTKPLPIPSKAKHHIEDVTANISQAVMELEPCLDRTDDAYLLRRIGKAISFMGRAKQENIELYKLATKENYDQANSNYSK